MLFRYWLIAGLLIYSLPSFAQCLTGFEKLLPEPSTDYTQDFGRTTAMYDNVLAVGSPNSDKSARLGGIVTLYKKIGTAWATIGILEPSIPLDGLLFGYSIEISEDYIVVGCHGHGGKVYIFRKPASGWASGTEIAILSVPGSILFGSNYRPFSTIEMSDDQQTLVVADPQYLDAASFNTGALYIYHKNSGDEWSADIAPVRVIGPEPEIDDFGSLGIQIVDNRIITKTIYAPGGIGAIYILHDPTGTFSSFQWEAKLMPGKNYDDGMFWLDNFFVTPEGIFTPAVLTVGAERIYGIVLFKKSADGWSDDDSPEMFYQLTDDAPPIDYRARLSFSQQRDDEFYLSYIKGNNTRTVIKFTHPSTSWHANNRETILSLPAIDPEIVHNYFSATLSSDGNNNVVVGLTELEDNPMLQLGLTVLSKTSGNSWTTSILANTEKSTVGHYFGSAVLGFDTYMFVAAPYDGTVKSKGGQVYTYKKSGDDWIKKGTIIPDIIDKYDDVFGTALAGQGDYLAIAAAGFEPAGKVLVYKKTSPDWETAELIQEIAPPDTLKPQACGDHLAMNNKWLVLPVSINPPSGFRIVLLIYQFNGSIWEYFQTLDIQPGNIFAKSATVAVDIDDETIVAGGTVLQRNTEGKWQAFFTLYNSDHEPMRIASDFSHWITNGDLFGQAVDIQGDHIFIGAPTKDDGETWDVGAVYVYSRNPGGNWSSGSETAKILPRIRDERELFGYSIKSLNNTLIVGAPGADFKKDGTARNKPGRAYVFQSQDYYWQNVIPLLDFTGNSSEKDYFGIQVNLDETDFFVSATIEDNQGDQFSGAVYTTPTPPLIKLIPPMCQVDNTINLFGYPFGGQWQGAGIIDAANGTFDTHLAGVGIHEITYTTPSCHFPGKLRIEIKEGPPAVMEGDALRMLCPSGQTSATLTVTAQPDSYYHWYFRKTEADLFTAIDGVSNSITVSSPGQYQAKVYNAACESFSDPVRVAMEDNPIVISQPDVVCNKEEKIIQLKATPSGGTWSGNYISNGAFNATSVPDGEYVIQYAITSQNQCAHNRTDILAVDRVPVVNYIKSGNVCDGTAKIDLSFTQNITVEWMQMKDGQTEFSGISDFTFIPQANGVYQARVSNEHCSEDLEPFTVNDQFTAQVSPEGPSISTCSGSPVEIKVTERTNDSYVWFYAENPQSNFIELPTSDALLIAGKSGLYKVRVDRGDCTFLSEVKEIQVLPSDSVFVPNVITPNDDGKNDVLEVVSENAGMDLHVFNRYGQRIFSGNGMKGWTGGEHPSGVYYWYVFFSDCKGKRQEIKGFVHLIR